jgi:hypothetical protein
MFSNLFAPTTLHSVDFYWLTSQFLGVTYELAWYLGVTLTDDNLNELKYGQECLVEINIQILSF